MAFMTDLDFLRSENSECFDVDGAYEWSRLLKTLATLSSYLYIIRKLHSFRVSKIIIRCFLIIKFLQNIYCI